MSYIRKAVLFVFAIAILMAGLVSTSPVQAQDVSAQIEEANAKWIAAVKSNDFATIEALYASDGLLLPSNSPPIEGPAAIAAVWKSWSELPNVDINFGTTRLDISSSRDLVSDYGWYTFAFDTDNGRFDDKGKYIVVWKKVDGVWKVVADIFNTNQPAQ